MKKLVLALMIALMLAPVVMASPATFYGRACLTTALTGSDKEYNGGLTDYDYTVWNNAFSNDYRFGADFKVNDNLTGKVEMRGGSTSSQSGGAVSVRHWYGLWNFGAGKLLVGRTWAPTFQAITGANYIDGSGDVQGSLREDGLQLWFDVGGGSLKIAALTPTTSTNDINDNAIAPYAAWDDRVYYNLPKLEVSYNRKLGPLDMNFFGGYQTVEYDQDAVVSALSESIDAYVLGLTGAWEPKPFFLKFAVYMAQNLDVYGWGAPMNTSDFVFVNASTISGVSNLNDTDYLNWALCGGFEVNDRFTVEAGWVHVGAEQDVNNGTSTTTYEASLDEYYVVATYKLADNVYIYPEIAISKRGDDETTYSDGTAGTAVDRGGFHTYGIYWQINF